MAEWHGTTGRLKGLQEQAPDGDPLTTLASFRDIHAGETIIVCGCGGSLNKLTRPEQFLTIGVNDVGRRFQPNYLVVVNPRNQFQGDRFRYVETSQAQYLFTQLELGPVCPKVVRFRLGAYGGTDFSNPDVLHYTQNSPYVALCLAVYMGAKRIGLIGVDFTDNHFFARTRRHPLTTQLATIDAQYRRLYEALAAKGVEVLNLSSVSRLTAFPKLSLDDFEHASGPTIISDIMPILSRCRVFFVNYRFLSCGDVFARGFRHAAERLRLESSEAWWDDPALPSKVKLFNPDLLFVVHGRRFVQRWGSTLRQYESAVWLVDEPYEVDDTATWSGHFDWVFVNDRNTVHRHRNACYLPVAYDEGTHFPATGDRRHWVGFVGGYNGSREQHLLALLDAGLLSYIVGGPWRSPRLRRVCLAENLAPEAVAELYRQTLIVVNVFREVHHYNRLRIPAFSLNPRIYEALACGALVISEPRDEIARVFPRMPTFSSQGGLVDVVSRLLGDRDTYSEILAHCRERLAGHSFRERLASVLAATGSAGERAPIRSSDKGEEMQQRELVMEKAEEASDWLDFGGVSRFSDANVVILSKQPDESPGSEQGLASRRAFVDVELRFALLLNSNSRFIAKLHQQEPFDQKTNSYHLFCHPHATYVARHNHIFAHVALAHGAWQHVVFRVSRGLVGMIINGREVIRVPDTLLLSGYSFLGIKGGTVQLRNIELVDLAGLAAPSRENGKPVPGFAMHQPPTQQGTEGFGKMASLNRELITTAQTEVLPAEWSDYGGIVHMAKNGEIVLNRAPDDSSGSERGLVSEYSYTEVELSFELKIGYETTFIAKVHQQDKFDQQTNSYHLFCQRLFTYIAKHNFIFDEVEVKRDQWQRVTLRRVNQHLEIFINDILARVVADNQLQSGYCFLGIKGGQAELRNIRLRDLSDQFCSAASQPMIGAVHRVSVQRVGANELPNTGDPLPRIERLSFSAPPLRNLIYHIWPVKGSMWRWNLEQLKRRIDIFNGRRIVGIVHDAKSESPDAVTQYLDGYGCEYTVLPNGVAGESITFSYMIRMITSQDPNEITFYAHAKGVKYEPNVPQTVRRWSEVLYRTNLDDWLTVWKQLQQFPLTGSFKMLGRFRSHYNSGDWHYSGAYFWMRHAHVFSRSVLEVPQFYGGVEAWPGIHFRENETGCLFLDKLRQLPYHDDFWRSIANQAIKNWEANVQLIPPPADLAQPPPFQGYESPRTEQKPSELEWWIRLLLDANIHRLLTIGIMHGGVEWHIARAFREHNHDIEITSVDLNVSKQALHVFEDAGQRFNQSMRLIQGDSSSDALRRQLDDYYDAVFIDGDHSYRGVRNDWLLAKSVQARLVGFHDIVDSHWHIQNRCCVSRLWTEIKTNHKTEEKASGDWGGIGVVRLALCK